MNCKPLLGVIFDMDGVLVDSHSVHRKAWRTFFQTLGREVSDCELEFILDGRKRTDILRHFLGNCSDPDLEEFGRRKDCIFRQMRPDVAAIRGAHQMVRGLYHDGVVLALATSASSARARSTLADLGLLNCFQEIVTGEDVQLGKPDPAIYRLAGERIGIPEDNLLAVEDAISGIQAAVGAGLCCLGVASHQTRESLIAAGAACVVPDFEALTPLGLKGILLGRNHGNLPNQAAAGSD